MKKVKTLSSVTLVLGLIGASQIANTAVAASPSSDQIHISDVKISPAKSGAVEQIVLNSPHLSKSGAGVPLAGLADLFGGAPNSSYSLDDTSNSFLKRFTQKIDGIPVLGSSVTQVLNSQNAVIAALGAVAESSSGTFPADVAAGQQKALQAAIKLASKGSTVADIAVGSQRPIWFDSKLVNSLAADSAAVPAYEFSLTTGAGQARSVIVAADEANTILQDESEQRDINRVICDRNSKNASLARWDSLRCGKNQENKPSRIEGQSPAAVTDVNRVYDYLGDTSAFYTANTQAPDLTQLIGLDENDGLGKAIRATVRACISGYECPYENAFWGNGQMTYGQGVTTDDITAHELTHGVTDKTNHLAYQNESGAINESMSDVFGEFVDLSNGSSDDTPAVRWQIGEGSSIGALRSMKDPTAYGDPAIYRGPNWKPLASNPNLGNDYGGVHGNSGVGNKLAFLITDGQTFNGQTVKGIGITKASQLYWSTQLLLTANATYSTLGKALITACNANVANNVAGTTSQDCLQVQNAIKAVKIA